MATQSLWFYPRIFDRVDFLRIDIQLFCLANMTVACRFSCWWIKQGHTLVLLFKLSVLVFISFLYYRSTERKCRVWHSTFPLIPFDVTIQLKQRVMQTVSSVLCFLACYSWTVPIIKRQCIVCIASASLPLTLYLTLILSNHWLFSSRAGVGPWRLQSLSWSNRDNIIAVLVL
jgi:hypothetical protein